MEGICWCPIDTREAALDLIAFLGKLGASGDLKIAYLQAEAQLIRDPLAPVAGWTALGGLFGQDGKQGIRRAFRAGLDLDVVERMSERYLLDISTHDYLDRERLLLGLSYDVTHDRLVRDYDNQGRLDRQEANQSVPALCNVRTAHRRWRGGHVSRRGAWRDPSRLARPRIAERGRDATGRIQGSQHLPRLRHQAHGTSSIRRL